ncbi:protein VACUOLELESS GAMETOPHYTES-like [Salvia miltiorrhiza]|uniref:protein VACUOLELESS GAMETOPHYTES-like n=1 Tax=Salvia miltiorrhiza TaxID=226208 RepID=UPI0025ABE7A1|nr:protein VACUOLELESS GAMETOPHYTES-like [Salvia miltiorrhiza]
MDDEEIIPHMFHEHPLSLIPNLAAETCYSWNNWCYGCFRFFLPGEAAYGCSQKCGFRDLFHKDCMEMPREIRHHLHPSHSLTLTFTLTQEHDSPYIFISSCAVCEAVMRGMYYECSGGCDWWIHLGCAGGFDEVVVDDNPTMKHTSHPQHHLKFSKKAILCCDACGATHKGKSYICTVCDYWIHERCALLPVSAHFPHHRPDHSLSLAFHIPYQYILYKLVCAICSGALPLRRWVYHCHLCNYVVHTNCAFRSPSNASNNENAVDDEKDIVIWVV